ncbi:LysR family transcriptional regulator [Rouxiella badensis]|uniref:helix-turn-helix domain-containing protein n=1 Tax=Rouxiella badensis TaxID=1646377 RepID=UPI00311AAFCC
MKNSYLVQLRSFLDVYRAGSISKAANRLGISQPAVSSHVHSLESLTGCVLFTVVHMELHRQLKLMNSPSKLAII